jgi:hypothetical protein
VIVEPPGLWTREKVALQVVPVRVRRLEVTMHSLVLELDQALGEVVEQRLIPVSAATPAKVDGATMIGLTGYVLVVRRG